MGAPKLYASRERVRIVLADESMVYRKVSGLTGAAGKRAGVAFVNGDYFAITEGESGIFEIGKKAKAPEGKAKAKKATPKKRAPAKKGSARSSAPRKRSRKAASRS